jgi:predicted metal-dependent hydrolase
MEVGIMNVTDFKIQFPEFARVPVETIEAHLAAALAQFDATNAGTYLDQIQAYKAAQLLARSPAGQAAKLVSKNGSTTYDTTLKELLAIVTAGERVI